MSNNIIHINIFNIEEGKVQILPMKYIVKLMVAAQVAINYQLEFLKVQAIIARTQLVRKTRAFGGKGCDRHDYCDICDDGHCIDISNEDCLREKWGKNYVENFKKISRAVEETEGLIITMNNKPIDARYNITCGGSTENSENVIGNKILYLRRVLCDYCKESPYWERDKRFSMEELERKLNVSFPKITPIIDVDTKGIIEKINRDEAGRIISMKIGGKEFKGTELIQSLGLDSTKFSISPSELRFKTRGKGDGLGLCQYGGNQMAKEGFSYEDIIKYYYTGVQVKELEKPCIKKPLKGKIIMIDPGHGGENSQDAVGNNGLREKDVVLKLGKRLAKLLRELGADIHLTREKDVSVPLNRRVDLSSKIRPHFFLSLHLNSFPNPSIHGCEIYHYRNDKESKYLGRTIMTSLKNNLEIIEKGIKAADFFLLREVGVNCLHLELDYITNPKQEEKLKDDEYLDKVANAIGEGIIDYFRY